MIKNKPSSPEKAILNSDIWTAKEVGIYLHVHEKTVTALARKGEIPGTQIGNQWRFSREKIKAMV